MADLFAFSDANWLFTPSKVADGDETPDLERHDGQIDPNGPLDYQGIGNILHGGPNPSVTLSDVDYKSHLVRTSTYPTDQSTEGTIRSSFDTSFLTSLNEDFTLESFKARGNTFRDVEFVTTQIGEYADCDFKSFDADMELHQHHTHDVIQSNIFPAYLINAIAHPSPVHGPSVSNVCTVHPTLNPRVFIFRCTFPRCRAKTFGRWFDFHRHYNGAHASEKTVFWCLVEECSRSEGGGNRGFPR